MNMVFIGGGNMATALVKGITESNEQAGTVSVVDPNDEARQRLQTDLGVTCHPSIPADIGEAGVIVLAVKPQIMPVVLNELGPLIQPGQLVISVAAGTSIATLGKALGEATAIIRTMPNTPALLGAGMTGLFAGSRVSEADRKVAEDLMSAVGQIVWVEEESLIDVVTAISGSGPAYFYLLTEAMAEAGTQLGLPPDTASQLARATAHGAGLMVEQADVPVAELRRRVTSPGGTTQAALETFMEKGFDQLVLAAATAAVNRGRELAELDTQ